LFDKEFKKPRYTYSNPSKNRRKQGKPMIQIRISMSDKKQKTANYVLIQNSHQIFTICDNNGEYYGGGGD
jgi:hypothetical protein